ncbi:MAG: hypothetical protein R6X34_00715 [Chloroflexota bacterium]
MHLCKQSPITTTRHRSPHSLAQDCLNHTDNYLWAFISNGLRFRILRDNVSLTRAAYSEFDLEAMFNDELDSGFTLFWLRFIHLATAPAHLTMTLAGFVAWQHIDALRILI